MSGNLQNIKILRLLTGELLIARLVENYHGTIDLVDAMAIIQIPTGGPSDPVTLKFSPAFPYARDWRYVTLRTSAIAYELDPESSIEEGYRQATSPIFLSKGGIVKP